MRGNFASIIPLWMWCRFSPSTRSTRTLCALGYSFFILGIVFELFSTKTWYKILQCFTCLMNTIKANVIMPETMHRASKMAWNLIKWSFNYPHFLSKPSQAIKWCLKNVIIHRWRSVDMSKNLNIRLELSNSTNTDFPIWVMINCVIRNNWISLLKTRTIIV